MKSYHTQEILYQSERVTVSRAIRESDGKSVILKSQSADFPSLRDLTRIKMEFELSRKFTLKGMVPILGIEKRGNGYTLVMEDVEGIPLLEYWSTSSKSLFLFLELAISISESISDLHSKFSGLIRQILAEKEEIIKIWKEKILQKTYPNTSFLLDLIPELNYLLGSDLLKNEPSKVDEEVFRNTFIQFIGVFAGEEHPLTLLIRSLEKEKSTILKIFLAPLHEFFIERMICDTFYKEVGSELPELIIKRTGGNPFFVKQFLETLYEDQCITYSETEGWCYDSNAIKTANYTENVVSLVANRLQTYSKDTLEILKLASCIGASFSLFTLSQLLNKSASETAHLLEESLVEGVLLPESNLYRNAILSSENESLYESLLEKLILLLIENAGAERGAILLFEESTLYLEGTGESSSKKVEIFRDENADNAIQAMGGKGTLLVEIEKVSTPSGIPDIDKRNPNYKNEYVSISIQDSGPGIPTEIRKKIFQAFFTTKKAGEGSGLGLHIIGKILEKHAGALYLESEPGRTRFSVLLPIQ